MIQRCCILLLTLLVTCRAFAQSDSLLAAYNKATDPEERGTLAFAIASAIPDSKPELYVAYARAGYAAVSNRNILIKGRLANVIGYYHEHTGAYDSAIYYFKIALATAKAVNNPKVANTMLGNLGEGYSLKGDYAQALNYELAALNYYEQQKDSSNAQRLILTVGNTYYRMHNLHRALDYFNRLYPAWSALKTQRAAGLFNSMGLVYGELGNRKKEADLLQRSLSIKQELGDSIGLAKTMNSLGKAAIARGDKAEATKWFTTSLAIARAVGSKVMADEEAQNLAFVNFSNGNTTDAIKQYKESLERARTVGDLRLEKVALENLFSAYDTIHNYDSAYRYIAEYESLQDTARSKDYLREVADAETKYETQKALRDRDRLQYEERLQAAAADRAVRGRNFAIGIGAVVLLALLLIFWLAWRIRGIRAATREEQGYTRAIFEGEQTERIRIARDLHDSIGQMLAVVKMRLSNMHDLPPAKLAESANISMDLVDKTISEVRTISHNLIPEELAFGVVRGLENLCNKINTAGEVEVQLTIADAVRARKFNQQFSLSLYRIIQEVLGNMIKHSGASVISVTMEEKEHLIFLQLTDNGQGFDTGKINASKGIGWKNIFARVNLLNGRLDVRSERISGTRIEITIPQ